MSRHLAGLTPAPPMRRRERIKEKPFFPQDYEKTGRIGRKPSSPSDTPDFRLSQPTGQPLQVSRRSGNFGPVTLLLLLPCCIREVASLNLLSSPLFPRANNLPRTAERKRIAYNTERKEADSRDSPPPPSSNTQPLPGRHFLRTNVS